MAALSSAAVSASSSLPSQVLFERLKDYGQQDALSLWNELSREEQDLLIKDIECLDLPRIDRIIWCSLLSQERTLEERERWWKVGLKAISGGELAVLLLSGGQVIHEEEFAPVKNANGSNFDTFEELGCLFSAFTLSGVGGWLLLVAS